MDSPTRPNVPTPFVTFRYTNWEGIPRAVQVRFCANIEKTRQFLADLLDTEVTT